MVTDINWDENANHFKPMVLHALEKIKTKYVLFMVEDQILVNDVINENFYQSIEYMDENNIEVWGYKTFRPFRIYWILYEYGLKFTSFKIGSRTGETQNENFLKMNPIGKIPILRHKDKVITESAAAVYYVTYNFKKPRP